MKKDKKILIITTILCLVPIILGLAMYDRLPEELAIHFDSAGIANGFMAKNIAIWLLPVFMAAINIFANVMMNNDPKRMNASVVARNIGIWLIPITSLILMPITLFKSIGYDIPIEVIMPVMVGVLIVVFGNYMPKCKQNYTVGIKLPWTLNDENNWNKTHRLAGYVWIIGGLAIIILSFVNFNTTISIITIIAVLVVVPIIHSYRIYRISKR